jgi:hypothetical protein
MIFLAECIW